MARERAARRTRLWLGIAVGLLVTLVVAAFLIWRDDILQALLDPQIPYAVYTPPPAPDYARPDAWALPPPWTAKAAATTASGPADVFFIHPTTFDGGKDWNGPIRDRGAAAELSRIMLPNYAAPFTDAGPIIAPRYRQASLYTSLTLWVDALEARRFAYGDVRDAFHAYLQHADPARPLILVGVEQGGGLAARLLREEIAPDPALRRRLAAAYLIETIVPADEYGPGATIPACTARQQAGCVLAWVQVRWTDLIGARRILSRSVVWNAKDQLVGLAARMPLCVNPVLGAATDAPAPERLNLGAVNATGLEWGAKPGFLVRQVATQCSEGLLRYSKPRSDSLRRSGSWAIRHKAPGFNLFYADLQADAAARVAAWQALNPPRSAPPDASRTVPAAPAPPVPAGR